MKTFSIEEINAARWKFTERYEQMVVPFRGMSHICFVLPPRIFDEKNEVPFFVYRMTPKTKEIFAAPSPDRVTLFAVSADVPEEFRAACLIHEMYEFIRLGVDAPHRCANSFEFELAYLRDQPMATHDMQRYLEMRLQLFEALEALFMRSNAYTVADLAAILETEDLIKRELVAVAA